MTNPNSYSSISKLEAEIAIYKEYCLSVRLCRLIKDKLLKDATIPLTNEKSVNRLKALSYIYKSIAHKY